MTRIKICGITRKTDALAAVAEGADALGFIFVRSSPRAVSLKKAGEIAKAVPPFVAKVGVFADAGKKEVLKAVKACRLDAVQLHGDETDKYCQFLRKYCKIIKVFRIKDKTSLSKVKKYRSADAFLFDTYVEGALGGTGKTFSHSLLKNRKFKVPVIVSGGIGPDNAAEIIRTVKPFAVDASSAIESAPGVKNQKKMTELIRIVKKPV